MMNVCRRSFATIGSASNGSVVNHRTGTATRTGNANSGNANPFATLWRLYSQSLQRRPLPTKMAAAVFIFTSSDLATQYIMYEHDEDEARTSHARKRRPRPTNGDNTHDDAPTGFSFNLQRSLSASSFGVVGTIYLHHWWNFLEKFVNARFPIAGIHSSSKLTNTLVKVAIDQSISAPLYNWCYFFITNVVNYKGGGRGGGTNANPMERVVNSATKSFHMVGPLLLDHWKMWPAIHTCNFYFTPVQNRVLVQNLVLVGWSGYLSHLNHSEAHVRDGEVVDEMVFVDTDEKKGRKNETQIKKSKIIHLKRHKTINTGIDIVEVEKEDEP